MVVIVRRCNSHCHKYTVRQYRRKDPDIDGTDTSTLNHTVVRVLVVENDNRQPTQGGLDHDAPTSRFRRQDQPASHLESMSVLKLETRMLGMEIGDCFDRENRPLSGSFHGTR